MRLAGNTNGLHAQNFRRGRFLRLVALFAAILAVGDSQQPSEGQAVFSIRSHKKRVAGDCGPNSAISGKGVRYRPWPICALGVRSKELEPERTPAPALRHFT